MFNQTISQFLNEHEHKTWNPGQWPIDLRNSDWPYAPINLKIDNNKVREELKRLQYFFVPHREKDKINSYGHEGWEAVTLHGIDYDKTENYDQYGYVSEREAGYRWTEVCDYAPHILEMIKSLPYERFGRVRIMRLKPGGYIMPHVDGPGRMFGPVNIALTQPIGCRFVFKDVGTVPFAVGKGFMLDIGIEHCIVNESNEDRYHIIVHGHFTKDMIQLIKQSL
jgi:hypothetical protein